MTSAAVPGLDVSRPHPARMYDYYLGGKDNFAADRSAADEILRRYPETRVIARQNRGRQASAATTNNMRHHTSCSAGSEMSLPRMAVMPHSTTQMWISMSARRWGFMRTG